MSAIRSVELARIFDSRGSETVEATITTDSGHRVRAGAPSGASTGRHEVKAFPDGGVPVALERFSTQVRSRLIGANLAAPVEVDRVLHEVDPTPDFSAIGGNTATAVSVAAWIAAAGEVDRPLHELVRGARTPAPYPAIVGNCLNGGRHAIGGPDIQEFLAVAAGPPAESIPAAIAVHKRVGESLHAKYPNAALGRGDEGGWVASIGNVEALEILTSACERVRTERHVDVRPGLDLAASEFGRGGRYRYKEQTLDSSGQVRFVASLVDKYGLAYVEDPFDEEDFRSFAELTASVGDRTRIVGDDLYTTRVERLRTGIESRSTNSILIKVNQVGTVSDALAAVDLAREHGLSSVTSHRSGEVPDSWLAQLALGFGSAGFKSGLLGGERVAKLNELLRVAAAAGS